VIASFMNILLDRCNWSISEAATALSEVRY
jgi:hypothetical protein